MLRSRTAPRVMIGAALMVAATPGSVRAGALEQIVPNTIRLLYQQGTYVEFGTVYAKPEQSGEGVLIPPTPLGPSGFVPGDTGQIFNANWSFSGAFKADLSDSFSFLVGFDEPLAGNTAYGRGTYAFPVYQGTDATMLTYQVTTALSYDVTPNVKIYGGLRTQLFDSKSNVSFFNYSVEAQKKLGFGYLVGAGYERPEIGLRVALTYFSSISYDLSTVESVVMPGAALIANTITSVTTPQSLQLDFQTGIAPKTLVFGYIRWVDWTQFDVTPPLFGDVTKAVVGQSLPLVRYEGDVWTFNVGIGHQFTDNVAASFSVTYEPKTGDEMPTLAPYDGQLLGTVGLSYDVDKHWNVTGGVTFGMLGDAKNGFNTNFDNGSVWGAGMRTSYTF